MDIGAGGATIGAMPVKAPDVTVLLRAWAQGDEAALHELMPLVERELNRIARRCLFGERNGCSVSATALVNEAFLRLVDLERIDWQDRSHFLSMAARLMRRVLVDHARTRQAEKRGGDIIRVTFDELLVPGQDDPHAADVLTLDQALTALAAHDRRKAQVIELRFFGGLTVEETAAALAVSVKTVVRDWTFAKAWLQREMGKSPAR
jgi:RNA polymerase sigma factor (TIGR02999 family)